MSRILTLYTLPSLAKRISRKTLWVKSYELDSLSSLGRGYFSLEVVCPYEDELDLTLLLFKTQFLDLSFNSSTLATGRIIDYKCTISTHEIQIVFQLMNNK